MTRSYIKKSLYPVNRLDFKARLLSAALHRRESGDREFGRAGSSLRSFRDIAKDADRRPEEAEALPACVVFEEYNRGLPQ